MWHQGQKPPSLIRIRCNLLRTWGKVAPEVFFEPYLLQAKEGVSQGDQGDVVMPAQPVTAFEVVQPEFLLQLAVVHLDPPTRVSHLHQAAQARQARAQLRQPVLGRFCFPFRPFDQQPFGHALRVPLCSPAMRGPHFQLGETRPLRAAGALAPRHFLPGRLGQLLGQGGEVLRRRCRGQRRIAPGAASVSVRACTNLMADALRAAGFYTACDEAGADME